MPRPAAAQPRVAQPARGPWLRRAWPWLTGVFALVAVAGVGFRYYQRAELEGIHRISDAQRKLKELERTLNPALFEAQHQALRQLVSDNRQPETLAVWLRYLTLRSLLTGQVAPDLPSALSASTGPGVDSSAIGLARMVHQLAGGRFDAAGRTLSRSDGTAGQDALFQTAAGLVLERAEPAAAAKRYQRALALNPQLAVAALYLVRLSLWTGSVEAARGILAPRRGAWEGDARLKALDAMMWLTDLENVASPPPSIRIDQQSAEQLPPTLDFVPLWLGVRAAEGTAVRETACAVAATSINAPHPRVALFWLAEQALQAHCIDAARTAAAKLLTVSDADVRATELFVLAELAEGRVDRAERRVASVSDAKSWKIALAAIRAYEMGDIPAIERADLSSVEPRASAAIRLFTSVLEQGGPSEDAEISALARPTCAWGELVSVDAALNHGKLNLAAKIVAGWPNSYQSPAHLLRLSRLRRYQGRADEASNFAEAAAYGNPTRQSLTERVLALLENGEDVAATDVVVQNAQHLGPLSTWLGALVTAKSAPRVAQRLLEPVPPPPAEAALGDRVVAAIALSMAGDPRARGLVLEIAETAPRHPDLVATGWLD